MSKSDYKWADRLIHRLALGSTLVSEASFDLEKSSWPQQFDGGRHVFIAGLARAGTTILMRMLYETGEFASLTYRDMPFALAPNLWGKLSARGWRNGAGKERAHGDGIFVDFESPEALEEVFWRTFAKDDYLQANRLVPMVAGVDLLNDFRRYISLILHRYQKPRYLSKNNNNILRLGSIRRAYPSAAILIPFREPLSQAASLLSQHKKFLTADKFTRSYMRWLGHHEFGADHRPFSFDQSTPTLNAMGLEYWLDLWVRTYSGLLEIAGRTPDVTFVSYERLCEEPELFWRILRGEVALDASALSSGIVIRKQNRSSASVGDPNLLSRAEDLHETLLRLSGW